MRHKLKIIINKIKKRKLDWKLQIKYLEMISNIQINSNNSNNSNNNNNKINNKIIQKIQILILNEVYKN
jgi:hypothetical protein